MRNNLPVVIVLLLAGCRPTPSTNLVMNGSAESGRHDSIPPGWTNVRGHWTALQGDSTNHPYGFAREGHYYFFAGQCDTGLLQQDIDVSAYADGVDARRQTFFLRGAVQSLDQGSLSDQGEIRVLGLDASKNKTLFTFDTDTIQSLSKWHPVSDTFMVAPLTRFLRLQLVSIRHVGGDNDGYIDDLVLTTQATGGLSWWMFLVAGVVLLAGGTFFFFSTRRKKEAIKQPR